MWTDTGRLRKREVLSHTLVAVQIINYFKGHFFWDSFGQSF